MFPPRYRPLPLLPLTAATALMGCASSTVIHSSPPGASVFINDSLVGFTPYSYTDRRVSFSKVRLRLQKDGYQPLDVTLTRDESVEVGNVVGGFMFFFPALWAMGYDPVHTYVLKPSRELPAEDWLEEMDPKAPADEESDPLPPEPSPDF